MDFAFALALAGAVLGAVSMVLHVVAPKTKTTVDDKVMNVVDAIKDVIPEPQPKQ